MKKITLLDEGFKPEIDEIIAGKLYLGNEEGSQNLEMLKQKGVTDILVLGSSLKEVIRYGK